jgi:hypothetical protein
VPIFQKIISDGVNTPFSAALFAPNFRLSECLSCAQEFSFGGDSPLDLINGHLPFPSFIPAVRGLPPELEPKNWLVRSSGFTPYKDFHYVAKFQAFKAGGYEAMVSRVEMAEVARRMDIERRGGVRVDTGQDEANVISSVNRSKKRLRHLIKSMGCDRMLTLTRRESDPANYWTVKQWGKAWDKFVRLCRRMGVILDYVLVLERHKKGNLHLHAAIAGHINVKHIRKIWLVCCGGGKGAGNVDIAYKTGLTVHQRRAGLAKYLSKYLVKQLGTTEFNKKRYWSSKHKLPAVVRYVLNSDDLTAALVELSGLFALDAGALLASVFRFKLDTSAWFAYDDKLAAPPPF